MIFRGIARHFSGKKLAQERIRARQAVHRLYDLREYLESDLRTRGQEWVADLRAREAAFTRMIEVDLECYNQVLPLLQEMVSLMPAYFKVDLEVQSAEVQFYQIQLAIGTINDWIGMINADIEHLEQAQNYYLHLDKTDEITELVALQNPDWPLDKAPQPLKEIHERRRECDDGETELRSSLKKLERVLRSQHYGDELKRIKWIIREKRAVIQDHLKERRDLITLKKSVHEALRKAKADRHDLRENLLERRQRVIATWRKPLFLVAAEIRSLKPRLDEIYIKLEPYRPIVESFYEVKEELDVVRAQIQQCHDEQSFSNLDRLKRCRTALKKEKEGYKEDLEGYWEPRAVRNELAIRKRNLVQELHAWKRRADIIMNALNLLVMDFLQPRPASSTSNAGGHGECSEN